MMKVATIREPESFAEAAKNPRWVKAMNEEMQALRKNEIWDLVRHSPHKKAIGYIWIYKVKYNVDDSVNLYEAHLVAKGYAQIHGVDYEDTFLLETELPLRKHKQHYVMNITKLMKKISKAT